MSVQNWVHACVCCIYRSSVRFFLSCYHYTFRRRVCYCQNSIRKNQHVFILVWQLFTTGIPVYIYGQCTDSGGGGTLEVLVQAFEAKGLTSDRYLITSCTLHNLQNFLRNAVMHVMGEGGSDDDIKPIMNCLQILHGAYNIRNWQEDNELKQL